LLAVLASRELEIARLAILNDFELCYPLIRKNWCVMITVLSDAEAREHSDRAFQRLWPQVIFQYYLEPSKDRSSIFHYAIVANRNNNVIQAIELDQSLLQGRISPINLKRPDMSCINLLQNHETRLLFRDYSSVVEVHGQSTRGITLAPKSVSYQSGKDLIAKYFRVYERKADRNMRESATGKILPIEWFEIEGLAEDKVINLLQQNGWKKIDS